MARADSTTPFPADVDRTAFGHWLSGFCDGEACFVLDAAANNSHKLPTPCARFFIKLRADDLAVLQQVQSFWQCGGIQVRTRRILDASRANTKPTAIYDIGKAGELARVVVAHFDRHPLRAKKQNDFLIWRQGVELLVSVARRPRQRLARPGHGGRIGGTLPRWTDEERTHFQDLVSALKQQRVYTQSPAAIAVKPIRNPASQRLLFGD